MTAPTDDAPEDKRLEVDIPLTHAGSGVEMTAEVTPKQLAGLTVRGRNLLMTWFSDEHEPLDAFDRGEFVRITHGDDSECEAVVLAGRRLSAGAIRVAPGTDFPESVELPADDAARVPAAEVALVKELDDYVPGWRAFSPSRIMVETLGVDASPDVYLVAELEATVEVM